MKRSYKSVEVNCSGHRKDTSRQLQLSGHSTRVVLQLTCEATLSHAILGPVVRERTVESVWKLCRDAERPWEGSEFRWEPEEAYRLCAKLSPISPVFSSAVIGISWTGVKTWTSRFSYIKFHPHISSSKWKQRKIGETAHAVFQTWERIMRTLVLSRNSQLGTMRFQFVFSRHWFTVWLHCCYRVFGDCLLNSAILGPFSR